MKGKIISATTFNKDNANAAGTQRFSLKSYDALNREVFSAYPGVTSTLTAGARTEYDALGRVIANKADSEMGVLTTTTQYLTGGGIKVTGPDGNFTTRTFRSLDAPSYDQMIQELSPGGVTTNISRDGFGKPLTITRSGTDGLSISKHFAYDSAQRLCMRTEPETGTSIIDYDAAGNVLWAANGQAVANPAVCNRAAAISTAKINYTYDALNRVTGTDVPSSSNDPSVTYLPDGTINTLTNGTAVWSYTYNKLGKPVTETLTMGTKISTITHAYDTLANESSLTYPSGTNIAYLPNALGQASKAGTYVTGMTYRASGFLTSMNYGNGAMYSALPNLRGLPARRLDKKGSTVIADELIGYDQDANPVCVRDSSTGNLGNRDFTFDGRNRLIKASAPNQTWMSSEYQYDSQDNIKLARLGTRQYNYTQNALNQLASITQPSSAPSAVNYGLGTCADASLTADLGNGSTGPSVAIPSAGTPGTATTGGTQTAKYTFTTDNEGRMLTKGTQAYVYDALNRMTQVTDKETYLYDGHGRRVQITKTSDSKINYPLYSLDGKLLVEDNRQTLIRSEYIYAGGRLVAKKLQPITSTGSNNGAATTTTIHTDFLGSPVAETNSSGTVTRIERYTPYGEPSDLVLDAGSGFTGHATDVATGLTNMQQRYYDAEIGRFLSPDPMKPDANTGGNFNVYWYADNNPVANVDPDGRCPGQPNGAMVTCFAGPMYQGEAGTEVAKKVEASKGAVKMTVDWITDNGSDDRLFSEDTIQSKQMQDAPDVNEAREFYFKKFQDHIGPSSQPNLTGLNVTNYDGDFGIADFVSATIHFDATEHFVGSYRIDIYGGKNGLMTFILSNNSSFKSLMYGVMPAWERNSTFPFMGNMRQTYTWAEKCCEK